MTPRTNTEVVARIWELWSAAAENLDEAGIHQPFAEGLIAPDCPFAALSDVVGAGERTFIGEEGLREFARHWAREWNDWRIVPEEIVEASGDRVVVVVRQSATGRTSGAPVTLRFAMLFELRDGRVVARRDYREPEQAFRAAGIER